jgi:hypothetical protein
MKIVNTRGTPAYTKICRITVIPNLFQDMSVIIRLGDCFTMKNFMLTPQNVVAANFSLRRIYAG